MSKQSTVAELIGTCIFVGVMCLSAFAAWRAGTYLALVALVPLAALGIWSIADMLRQGLRRPTAFERFETRLLVRFVLIVVGGGAAVALLYWAGYAGAATLVLVVVLLAGLLSANKLRGRHETSAGYKHRVGYRDPDPWRNDTGEG